MLSLALVACGGAQRGYMDNKTERWDVVAEKTYTFAERCMAGPFEVTFPARPSRWGRLVIVDFIGNGFVPVRMKMWLETPDGETSAERKSSASVGAEREEFCRRDETVEAAAPAAQDDDDVPPEGDEGSEPGGDVQAGGAAEAGASRDGGALSVPATGEAFGLVNASALSGNREHRFAVAYWPTYAPKDFPVPRKATSYYEQKQHMGGEVHIRFWFHEPVDLQGMGVRLRDAELRPKIDETRYAEQYRARVQATREDRESEDLQAERRERKARSQRVCDEDPSRCLKPPPPAKRETVPPSPGEFAVWVSGYWQWDEAADDYAWVPGTFIVRIPEAEAEAEAEDELEHDTRGTLSADASVELSGDIPPQPAPRQERIPPPPAQRGAVWVPGYWQLEARTWVWVPGEWTLPPKQGARLVVPRVKTRGSIRVYLPGGWSNDGD
jgi:hypothetical protein